MCNNVATQCASKEQDVQRLLASTQSLLTAFRDSMNGYPPSELHAAPGDIIREAKLTLVKFMGEEAVIEGWGPIDTQE